MSRDGRRVLLSTVRTEPEARYRVFDRQSRRTTPVAGIWVDMRFNGPTGDRLIGRQPGSADGSVWPGWEVRTNLRGKVAVRYANSPDRMGVWPTPDGKHLVGSFYKGTPTVNNTLTVSTSSDGRQVRVLTPPAGMSQCDLRHFTSNTAFTAECHPVGHVPNKIVPQIYQMDIRGTRPVALTSKLPHTGSGAYGYVDSWSTPQGQLVATQFSSPNQFALVRNNQLVLLKTPKDSSLLTAVGSSVWYLGGTGQSIPGGRHPGPPRPRHRAQHRTGRRHPQPRSGGA